MFGFGVHSMIGGRDYMGLLGAEMCESLHVELVTVDVPHIALTISQ